MTEQASRKPAKPKATKKKATAKSPSSVGLARASRPAVKKSAVKKASKPPVKAAGAKATARPKATKQRPAVTDVVVKALEDLKAQNITVIDVRDLTTVTDSLVIASGTSDRHVKSLAASVVSQTAIAGYQSLGREGERDGEWVLVDLGDVIVHVMLPRVREFYGLEKLWDVRGGERASQD